MAIASGLTCVNYLATNFHSPNYQKDDLRYSPTLNFNDLFSTYIQQQQQQKQQQKLNDGKELERDLFQTPLLEFQTLSIEEDTSFDFTTCNSGNNNTDISARNHKDCKTGNEAFITQYEKVKDILHTGKKTVLDDESTEELRKHLPPFSVNDESCRESRIPYCGISNITGKHGSEEADLSDDEEVGSIFGSQTSVDSLQELFRFNVDRAKSNSLPSFHKFSSCSQVFDEDEFSDSECELTKIISAPSSPYKIPSQNSKMHNTRKRRTSADFLTQPVGLGRFIKRPCIDAEKMHRSIHRGDGHHHRPSRRNLEKALFVPIASLR